MQRLTVLKMMRDVLDCHGRIVDENADRERKPAERHDVESFAKRPQHRNGTEHRQGNRDRDNQG